MSSTLAGFILATASIAALHASLPDHWLPFVLVGRAQRWSGTRTVIIAALAGLGHVSVTTLLGSIVAMTGFEVLRMVEEMAKFFAGILLTSFGTAYTILGLKSRRPRRSYKVNLPDEVAALSLIGMLTFSPCIAIVPVFFAASPMGLSILVPLSMILTLVTAGGNGALHWLDVCWS